MRKAKNYDELCSYCNLCYIMYYPNMLCVNANTLSKFVNAHILHKQNRVELILNNSLS